MRTCFTTFAGACVTVVNPSTFATLAKRALSEVVDETGVFDIAMNLSINSHRGESKGGHIYCMPWTCRYRVYQCMWTYNGLELGQYNPCTKKGARPPCLQTTCHSPIGQDRKRVWCFKCFDFRRPSIRSSTLLSLARVITR